MRTINRFSEKMSKPTSVLLTANTFLLSAILAGCGGGIGGSDEAGNNSSPLKSSSDVSSSLVASSVVSSMAASTSSAVNMSYSSSSSESFATICDFPTVFSWESSPPLITPHAANHASVKDPTIVYYNGLYHVFATVFDTSRADANNPFGLWGAVYLNFSDFSQANDAPQIPLVNKGPGDSVAPHVFYFRPHNKWYLIAQWGAKYSTNTDISNPDTWTAPKSLLANGLGHALDYWVICDDAYCHLFFSADDGNLYRSKTTIDNFPNFSGYEIIMQDKMENLFEGASVYKVEGKNQYLLLVEAMEPRYFRSWTATSLDGPWTPLADTMAEPFAGPANVTFPEGKWNNGISQGELIRSGYDEKMEINLCDLQYFYQGFDPAAVAPMTDYTLIPYRLGLLKAKW